MPVIHTHTCCSIIDYQHDPSDVVGAALLGSMIALVYLLRAIPRFQRITCCGGEGTGERKCPCWHSVCGPIRGAMVQTQQ